MKINSNSVFIDFSRRWASFLCNILAPIVLLAIQQKWQHISGIKEKNWSIPTVCIKFSFLLKPIYMQNKAKDLK
jgi:hypothetical protein